MERKTADYSKPDMQAAKHTVSVPHIFWVHVT